MRGMGRIFKRGSVYWVAYYHRGEEHRESSRSENENKARKLLKKRIGETSRGQLIGPTEEKLMFDDLAKFLLTDYEINRQTIDRICSPVAQTSARVLRASIVQSTLHLTA